MDIFEVINSNKNDNVCSICLDTTIKDIKVYQCNRCKYQFHLDCLKEWIKYKMECPNCRFSKDEFYLDFDMINAMLIYNEYDWHNFELHYNLSQYIYTIVTFIRNIILFTICFIFFILYYFK